MSKLKNQYLNQLVIVALILISLYLFARIGYHGNAHKRAYLIFRLIANLGFPLMLMAFGALFLNRDKNLFDFKGDVIDTKEPLNGDMDSNRSFLRPVKELYSYLLIPFVLCALICIALKILFLNGDGGLLKMLSDSISTFFSFNWFMWIILSSVLVIPILNEFIRFEKKEGLNYFIILFVIASILWSLSKQFNFSLYYIDLVFFAEPFAFMVLGFYLDKIVSSNGDCYGNESRDDELNTKLNISNRSLFIISLMALVIVLGIRSFLVYKGLVDWNAFFIKVFGTKISLSLDIFTIIECSAIFLMIRTINCNDTFNRIVNANILNRIIEFLGRNVYPLFLILTLVTSILSGLDLKYPTNFLYFSLGMTALFLIFAGLLLFVLDKVPYLNKLIGTRFD